ncbi:hypothetical protein ES332_D09G254400v1 [Gossypium tomentosum]|uniref:KIB1-4 beta-propeller domain-containing protein n=1 Tax=Gossypium tomentosum TaxID=34277 RepID=A0A5D2JLL6_GOSTO|nr:hypothetical protein ES332_D09G254400v1 [Gossypium tomentosum]
MNSDWAVLPSELVDLILQRLASVSDYFRFGATCTAWHAFIKDNKLLPLPFQVPYVDRFVGSSNRWLVTVDDGLVVRLLNPLCLVLGKQIDRDLNTYITLPPLDPPCFVFNHIRKVVLSANPASSPDDYMVMAIFNVDHHVAYIRPRCGGIIYFNVADRSFFKYRPINHNVDLENFEIKYLVESPAGELLLLDSEGWEWREMKNIGDCALFVGDNNSLSVVASDFCGCQSNCIYFIDDYENFLFPSMVLENSYALKNTKDVGVYNMETRSLLLMTSPRMMNLLLQLLSINLWSKKQ